MKPLKPLNEEGSTSPHGPLPTRTLFDTADYPLPRGVNPRDVTSRHLLYEAETFCLDIRHEREPGTVHARLIGQLADREDPLQPLADVHVILLTGEEVLAETTSDRMGEFQLDYELHPAMTLRVLIGEGYVLEVPVDRRARKRPPATEGESLKS